MRSNQRRMRGLALVVCAALVSSCASRALNAYPPSADLKVEAKPQLAADALASVGLQMHRKGRAGQVAFHLLRTLAVD